MCLQGVGYRVNVLAGCWVTCVCACRVLDNVWMCSQGVG